MRKMIAVLIAFVLSFSCLVAPASATEITSYGAPNEVTVFQIEDGWTYRGSFSHEVTWTEGLIAAAGVYGLAELISARFPVLKASHIYSAGSNTLATIAAATTGGTLYVEYYTYTAPYQATQEMYVWTFTPWTGSPVLGPIRYIDANVISSVGDGNESE